MLRGKSNSFGVALWSAEEAHMWMQRCLVSHGGVLQQGGHRSLQTFTSLLDTAHAPSYLRAARLAPTEQSLL